jgi:hypothetical protein
VNTNVITGTVSVGAVVTLQYSKYRSSSNITGTVIIGAAVTLQEQ